MKDNYTYQYVVKGILKRVEWGASKIEAYEYVSSFYRRLSSEERTKLYELIDDLY